MCTLAIAVRFSWIFILACSGSEGLTYSLRCWLIVHWAIGSSRQLIKVDQKQAFASEFHSNWLLELWASKQKRLTVDLCLQSSHQRIANEERSATGNHSYLKQKISYGNNYRLIACEGTLVSKPEGDLALASGESFSERLIQAADQAFHMIGSDHRLGCT